MARSVYLPIATSAWLPMELLSEHRWSKSTRSRGAWVECRREGVGGVTQGGEVERERERGGGGRGDIQHRLTPLTEAVQWEIIFGFLWYHQSDRNHIWNLSEVASLVHTRKHQQVLTRFGFFSPFWCFSFPGWRSSSLSLSPLLQRRFWWM